MKRVVSHARIALGLLKWPASSMQKAAVRACRNAIEFNSLPAVRKVVPGGYDNLRLHVKLGSPRPVSALAKLLALFRSASNSLMAHFPNALLGNQCLHIHWLAQVIAILGTERAMLPLTIVSLPTACLSPVQERALTT